MTARSRPRRVRRWASDLLQRLNELKRLDRLRRRLPRSSPDFEALAVSVEEKTREVLEVVHLPQVTVGPNGGGGWRVSGLSETFETQAKATKAARAALMKLDGGELVIRGRDGKVRKQNTIAGAHLRHSKG
jgi:hypothetical protein